MKNSGMKPGEDLGVKERQKTKKPPLYRVVLLNDDYTSMDFVVYVLESIFRMPVVEATQVMLHVHKKGAGVAGVYTREIAETKVDEVHELARENEFPLRCVMEKE
jgi:ATP-dependent Clp protease adaptor protein ClpS